MKEQHESIFFSSITHITNLTNFSVSAESFSDYRTAKCRLLH